MPIQTTTLNCYNHNWFGAISQTFFPATLWSHIVTQTLVSCAVGHNSPAITAIDFCAERQWLWRFLCSIELSVRWVVGRTCTEPNLGSKCLTALQRSLLFAAIDCKRWKISTELAEITNNKTRTAPRKDVQFSIKRQSRSKANAMWLSDWTNEKKRQQTSG